MKNANRFASGSRRVAFPRIVVSLIPCSWIGQRHPPP